MSANVTITVRLLTLEWSVSGEYPVVGDGFVSSSIKFRGIEFRNLLSESAVEAIEERAEQLLCERADEDDGR